MSEQTAYPLCWPEGWKRTPNHQRTHSRFTRPIRYANARVHAMSKCREFLARELRLLGATKEVLSTNVELRLDGSPYSNRAQPQDPGAAVYFELKQKPVAMACDKWLRVEDNVYAIAKHIESLRAQDRWGVGSIEQAFRDQVREAYLVLVRKHHPDAGGDPELFRQVQEAWELFERQTKKPQAEACGVK